MNSEIHIEQHTTTDTFLKAIEESTKPVGICKGGKVVGVVFDPPKEYRETLKNKYHRNLEGYKKLVGNLYPRIVYIELLAMAKEYTNDFENGWLDLEPVKPPNERGYAQ